jgi:hypothetical protein
VRASVSLCGGFHPTFGVEMRDDEDRVERVLFCFSCNEVGFTKVLARGADEPVVPHLSQGFLTVSGTRTGVDPIWWTVSLRCFLCCCLHGVYQLEFDRAVVIERRVAAARVVEAVDVFAN